ncbi:MAG: EAL domain-containing protein, partial [Vicinamibacteria bacterium]|nr:EAL domain-containing protein [Vicinamibacteria bacterium]
MASLLKMVYPPGGDPLQDLLSRSGEFRSVFQPVISLTEGKAIGFEGLLRLPADLALNNPGAAFAAATGTPWLLDLELAALDSHLAAVADLPDGRLFLNLTPTALLDPRFQADEMVRRIRKCRLSPEQVVIEISELENVLDPEGFASAISPLRDLHFQIAIDDFGAGFANVRLLVDLGPEFLKIDRALVTGASRHPRKRAFLETIAHLGQRVNCAVIAEGVETEDDLATVRACGIRGLRSSARHRHVGAGGRSGPSSPRLPAVRSAGGRERSRWLSRLAPGRPPFGRDDAPEGGLRPSIESTHRSARYRRVVARRRGQAPGRAPV